MSVDKLHNSFISVTTLVNGPGHIQHLQEYLKVVHEVLQNSFTDFEIIIVNNYDKDSPVNVIEALPQNIKQHIFLLQLASPTDKNHAILAGLDRANGDYTIIFEIDLFQYPELILQLYEKTQEKYDIVYLKAQGKVIPFAHRLFYKIFYYILKNYSSLRIDENAFDSRIISRRALNSLLRLRESLRYMKAIYSLVGYNTTSIQTDLPSDIVPDIPFREKFRTSLVAITSYTSFLRSLLLWIFIFSALFLVGVITNAIKVKLTGTDIFGNVGQAVSGWAFLVILISVFFAVMCLNLYIMSIYLSNIYEEIKQRPLYIIESIKRF